MLFEVKIRQLHVNPTLAIRPSSQPLIWKKRRKKKEKRVSVVQVVQVRRAWSR